MKRDELVRKIEQCGSLLINHGGKHDWYQTPNTKVLQPLPRYREIVDSLASHIIKKLTKGER